MRKGVKTVNVIKMMMVCFRKNREEGKEQYTYAIAILPLPSTGTATSRKNLTTKINRGLDLISICP